MSALRASGPPPCRRRELNGWKTLAPSPGIWGRKILLVGIFSETDQPACSHAPSSGGFLRARNVNDFPRRFRVRQIERLLLRTLRSPESAGIPVRARGGPPLGCVPLQLFGYFLRGTRQSHFTCAPRIRPSPVQKGGIERVEDLGPEPRNLG